MSKIEYVHKIPPDGELYEHAQIMSALARSTGLRVSAQFKDTTLVAEVGWSASDILREWRKRYLSAKEITPAEARIIELLEALMPFAEAAQNYPAQAFGDGAHFGLKDLLTVGDLRRAHAVFLKGIGITDDGQ